MQDKKYSQPCLSRSRISQISPKSKVYTRNHSFIFYCCLPHISRIFSESKLFFESQEIRLRQGWLYILEMWTYKADGVVAIEQDATWFQGLEPEPHSLDVGQRTSEPQCHVGKITRETNPWHNLREANTEHDDDDDDHDDHLYRAMYLWNIHVLKGAASSKKLATTHTVKPRPEAHMDMILFEVFLKSIDWFHNNRYYNGTIYIIDNIIVLSDIVESSGYSSKTLQKGSCPYAPLDEVLRYVKQVTSEACFENFNWSFINWMRVSSTG